MNTGRTTKVLLALIAMALFLNAIVPVAQPTVVHAIWKKRDPVESDFQ